VGIVAAVRNATACVLAVAGLVLSAAGCAGNDQSPTTSSTVPDGNGGAKPFPTQARASLAAGTYVVASFAPPVTVKVPAGFESGESLPERFGIQKKSNIAVRLIFQRPKTVVDASPQLSSSPAPPNMVTWLKQHPDLKLGRVSSVTIGGLHGKSVSVKVKGSGKPPAGTKCGPEGPCVPLFPASGSNELVSVFRNETNRLYVLKQGSKSQIVIVVTAPPGGAKTATRQLGDILGTVRFG
jgi:hypothetical protein